MASVTISEGNGNIRITYTQTRNEDNNTSTIAITNVEGMLTNYTLTIALDGVIQVNGQTVFTADAYQGTHVKWMSSGTYYSFGSGSTITVPHNDDGSLTLTFKLIKNDHSGFLFMRTDTGASVKTFTNGITTSATATANNVGKVRIYTSSGWVSATPYIYTSSGWTKAIPYVYTSSGWTKAK